MKSMGEFKNTTGTERVKGAQTVVNNTGQKVPLANAYSPRMLACAYFGSDLSKISE